jgi:hypothetical protein
MGIRPKISVIIGATDVVSEDPRFTQRLASDSFYRPLPKEFLDGSPCHDGLEGKSFTDVLYNPENNPNEFVEGVVGYELAQTYADDIAYALYTCFPDIFLEDDGYGYKEFPKQEIPTYAKEILESGQDSPSGSLQAVQFCHQHTLFYEFDTCDQITYQFQLAKKTLELAGWNFDYAELKKLLVWGWA